MYYSALSRLLIPAELAIVWMINFFFALQWPSHNGLCTQRARVQLARPERGQSKENFGYWPTPVSESRTPLSDRLPGTHRAGRNVHLRDRASAARPRQPLFTRRQKFRTETINFLFQPGDVWAFKGKEVPGRVRVRAQVMTSHF